MTEPTQPTTSEEAAQPEVPVQATDTESDENSILRDENEALRGRIARLDEELANRRGERELARRSVACSDVVARVFGVLQVLAGEDGDSTIALDEKGWVVGLLVNRLGRFKVEATKGDGALSGRVQGMLHTSDTWNGSEVPSFEIDTDGLKLEDEQLLARVLEVPNGVMSRQARARFMPKSRATTARRSADPLAAFEEALRAAGLHVVSIEFVGEHGRRSQG